MATNALVIEFGAEGPLTEDAMKAMQAIVDRCTTWKKTGTIEAFRMYPVVTGNRSQRIALIVLEMSHEQLEALVVNKEYPGLMETIASVGTNLTTSRAITMERMMELAKQLA